MYSEQCKSCIVEGCPDSCSVKQAYKHDLVGVVRCRDCKYMTEHYDTDGNVPYWICSEWDSGTDYDGFCHLAERRSDGID